MIAHNWLTHVLPLGLAGSLALTGWFGGCKSASAQNITLDGTLGPARTLNGPRYLIRQADGQTVGSNLFHSFGKFGLNIGERVDFQSAANIRNILSRVTGGSASYINGLIFTESASVNLFLINPSGIIFGPNAQLDVGYLNRGSFVATTLDSLIWPDGSQFSASNPGGPSSLLSIVGDPSGFISSLKPPRPITVSSTGEGFSVYPSQSLLLLGGDVTLDGSFLGAAGGRIELAGIAEPGEVGLDTADNNLSLRFPNAATRSDVSLTNQASVIVSGEGGGSVQIQGRKVTLEGGSSVVSNTLGSLEGGEVSIRANQLIVQGGSGVGINTNGEGRGGTLTVTASDFVELSGVGSNGFPGGLFVQTAGPGDSGNLAITTGDLIVRDGAQIEVGTAPSSTGRGGTLTINASNNVEVLGGTEQFPSVLSVDTRGTEDAGNLTITSRNLIVRDGAYVSASTLGSGDGGNLTIRTSESVEVNGTSSEASGSAPSGLYVNTDGTGAGGNLLVQTRNLIVQDRATISAQAGDNDGSLRVTGPAGNLLIEAERVWIAGGAQVQAGTFSEGRGGTLTVNASDAIEIIGTDGGGSPSGLFTATYGAADAGNLTLTTDQLRVRDGGTVSTSTAAILGRGRGGDLTIRASEIEVVGSSNNGEQGYFSSSLLAETGRLLDTVSGLEPALGGNLRLNTERLTIRNGGRVSTETFGLAGRAGDLTVVASEVIRVLGQDSDGNISSLTTRTTSTGDAGNLTIRTGRLTIQGGAAVTTSTSGYNPSLQTLTRGRGGILDVTAADSVEVIGVNSGLVSLSLLSTGDAGSLAIRTGRLIIRDGATVSTSSIGTGRGGDLDITASDSVEVSGSGVSSSNLLGLAQFTRASSLSTEATSLKDAGNLTINTGRLIVRDGAEVSANTQGLGSGGNIRIQANSLSLLNNAGISSRSGTDQGSAVTTPGNAGNVFINIRDTLYANNSVISTTAAKSSGGAVSISAGNIRLDGDSDITTFVSSGAGGGGNITLNADTILAFNDSDILAFARDGRGGNITLDTPVFFGFRYQPASSGTAPDTLNGNGRVDVNATGRVSSGIITLPDTTFLQNSLTQLPANLIDTNTLLANSCIARSNQQSGRFTITGAGGLPALPNDLSSSTFETYTVPSTSNSPTSSHRPWQMGDPVVEPQGLYRLGNGQLVLSRECQ
ncbi:filamentous hemagglutinin N-terminal domain-containing protein [Leptolyngbya sp. FACHB-261]|uniref:two-partner secretion domain-containing protein n=1 Tax=Leptolyngbya sp. FACHB-261 TaxID=2692806 RepID=UPI0016841294|nr:filamentous hemagglutinin N-terminal domain-containing protein [Leptolyngbya sp. FACHB-261]MBD2100850.1 filamentous hemagglutinin N-terminal domain-containing protein [Leptolyngbya sp. FACHB-261]